MTDANKFSMLIEMFTPHPNYEIEDYYGVTMMTIKKDLSFSIQLQYGYKKKAENSSSLLIKSIEPALEAYRILMKYAKTPSDLHKVESLDFLQ